MNVRMTFAILLAFGSFLVMGFQNCSQVQFGMDDKAAAMKQGVLDEDIYDGNGDPDEDGIPNYEDEDDDNDGIPDDEDIDDDGDGTPDDETIYDDENNGDLTLPTRHLCSDAQSEAIQSNAMTAKTLKLEVRARDNKVVCTGGTTDQIRAALQKRSIYLPNCKLADGAYTIAILNENGKNLVTKSKLEVENGKIEKNETEVLMDSNPVRKSDDDEEDRVEYKGTECDKLASPLFVDLRRRSTDVDVLSSPEKGVQFDVLGANGTPAYSKSQISWFKNGKFGLVALPDSQGKVRNIDQLFGDNTKGPDGKFSANGFVALAKYDLNNDKRIDSKDAVFSKLKLWVDKNRNAKSDAGELLSLTEHDIVAIDLEYDPNYRERDKYGNEIKYKSAVELTNGKFQSIFDVWFKLN